MSRNWIDVKTDAIQAGQVPAFGPSGESVYRRTYSRVKPDGTNETWWDTVNRVVDGNLGLVDSKYIEDDERQKLVDLMYSFKILPAGRHLWASGVPGSQYLTNCFVSHWTDRPSEHYEFSFMRAMEGGGVGTNYSAKYLPKAIIKNALEVHVVCDEWNPDYSKMVERGLISTEYGQQWHGAYAVEDSREGWAAAIVDLVDTFFRDDVRHQKRVYDVTKVRPEGAPLKSFGGSASGPAPLAVALKDMARVLSDHIGEPLTPLMAMELDHILAQCVLAGGVRRTARMSIVDWDDPFIFDFINCKSDSQSHWTTNISVGVDDRFFELMAKGVTWPESILTKVAEGMLSNGEPGFVNFALARQTDPDVVAVNPCLSGKTEIPTSSGLVSIEDWAWAGDVREVWDGSEWVRATAFPSGRKPTVKLKLSNGRELVMTGDHKVSSDGAFLPASEMAGKVIDVLRTEPVMESIDPRAVVAGLLHGDGSWHKASRKWFLNVGQKDAEVSSFMQEHDDTASVRNYCGKELVYTNYTYDLDPVPIPDRMIPDRYFRGSPDVVRSFLRGLYSANGSAVATHNRVNLKSVNRSMLLQVIDMLALLGIRAGLVTTKATPVMHRNGTYVSREAYSVTINGVEDVSRFADRVGFIHEYKNLVLKKIVVKESVKGPKPIKVVSVDSTGIEEDVYDFTMQQTHYASIGGFKIHNCGEQFLGAWDACNLGHVNLAAFDFNDSDGLYEAHRLMARFLVRATFGDKADEKQRDAVERNRRIGVGHLGFASFLALNGIRYSDAPANDSVKFLLHMLYTEVREAADKYAYQLRIPSSLKVTTVAPTGSIAKLPGVTEGLHPPMYKWFIRRIRFSTVRPDEVRQLEEFAEQGFKIEDDLYAANTKVVEIPTEESLISDVAARGVDDPHWLVQCSTDLTADEMLAVQAMYQEHYSDSGVSCTVNVQPEELDAEELARLLAEYLPTLKGCTVFPSVSRPQSPYEEITEEEYGQSTARTVADSVDLDCSSGACPIR